MTAMDDKKVRIVAFVARHWDEHGYSPTLQQIADATGYASAAGAHNAVWALIAEGRLSGSPGRSLAVPDHARADG